MLVSTGAAAMVLPALMGVLIPLIGINWVLAIPALCCLLIIVPFAIAIWQQRHTLHSQNEGRTMKDEMPLSTKAQQ
jgi:fucose permease